MRNNVVEIINCGTDTNEGRGLPIYTKGKLEIPSMVEKGLLN